MRISMKKYFFPTNKKACRFDLNILICEKDCRSYFHYYYVCKAVQTNIFISLVK